MDFLVKDAIKNISNSAKELDNYEVGQANMFVVGCGGAGQNMVDWIQAKGIDGAMTVAINTDLQDLKLKNADKKILIGAEVTRGLGAGGQPEIGANAANESITEIKETIKNADLVFVCAGLGGGTGTGSAPTVAKVAKDGGAIVIGVVTMPFQIERARCGKADYGLMQLKQYCDTVVVIDNNRLVKIAGNLPIQQSFAVANELITTMIKGIVEIINVHGLVNLDFADVKAIMKSGGVATMGLGSSNTKRRVEDAVEEALGNPLLDIDYSGAKGALIHVTGDSSLTLEEVDKIGKMITKSIDPNANVIWGARIIEDKQYDGRITIMTIMTGVSSPQLTGSSDIEVNEDHEHSSNDLGIKHI